MDNEDFVSYKIAQALKKAGFDWGTDSYYGVMLSEQAEMLSAQLAFEHNDEYDFCDYHERVPAPTLAQAQKWLREVHRISVEPVCNMVRQWNINVCEIDNFGEALWAKIGLNTYETALSAGIEAALKLIEGSTPSASTTNH